MAFGITQVTVLVDGAAVIDQELYLPCQCHSGRDGTINLDCANRALNDSETSEILKNLLLLINNPEMNVFVTRIDLDNNKLTRVPGEIRHFHQLENVYLNFNQIVSIGQGAFNFTGSGSLTSLYLIGNRINKIEPGAFAGRKLTYHISHAII